MMKTSESISFTVKILRSNFFKLLYIIIRKPFCANLSWVVLKKSSAQETIILMEEEYLLHYKAFVIEFFPKIAKGI